MQHVASLPPGLIAVSGVARVEYGLIVLAAVLVVGIFAIRAKRDHDQKIRKAASVGYYDPDAAHYWRGGIDPEPGDNEVGAIRSLAPSFTAPAGKRAGRQIGGAQPLSVPSAFGTLVADGSEAVPAFDPAAAVYARPPNRVVPLTPPPPSPALSISPLPVFPPLAAAGPGVAPAAPPPPPAAPPAPPLPPPPASPLSSSPVSPLSPPPRQPAVHRSPPPAPAPRPAGEHPSLPRLEQPQPPGRSASERTDGIGA